MKVTGSRAKSTSLILPMRCIFSLNCREEGIVPSLPPQETYMRRVRWWDGLAKNARQTCACLRVTDLDDVTFTSDAFHACADIDVVATGCLLDPSKVTWCDIGSLPVLLLASALRPMAVFSLPVEFV